MDLKFVVQDDKYLNVKDVLRGEFRISSRLFVKLRNSSKIFLNGKAITSDSPLSFGDVVEIELGFDEESENVVPTKIELDIIYEDDYLLILNKPADISVHPSMRHFDNSLSNRC